MPDDSVPRRTRMRSADAAWIGVDRPSNPMVVTAVLRLDGDLDVGAFRALVAERVVARYPGFSRRAVASGRPLLPPRWQDCETDLTWHVSGDGAQPDLAGEPVDDAALRARAGELVSQPLDPARPPWRLHVLSLADGGSAVVARLHHSLADGIALAGVLLGLTDPLDARSVEPLPGGPPSAAGRPSRRPAPPRPLAAAVAAGLLPLRVAASLVATVTQVVATLGEPATALRGGLGPAKQVAWTTPAPLDAVRASARARGVTVNDLLLAATAGGLRAHLLEVGGPVADLRALAPVDLRRGRPAGPELGNRFGVVFVPLPVGDPDRELRLRSVARTAARLRHSAQAGATYVVLTLVGALPGPVQQLAVTLIESSASVVVTNVPGPREPLQLAGHRVRDVVFWVPQVGRIGVGISLFSYAGSVTVGVSADARLPIDPAALAQAVETELEALSVAPATV